MKLLDQQSSGYASAAKIIALLFVAACFVPYFHRAFSVVTEFDDAYMYLRYAANILAGEGMVWNRGSPPIYGLTSLLYLAFVVLLGALPFPLGDSSLLVFSSVTMSIASLILLAACCARFCRSRYLGSFHVALVGLTLLLAFRRVFFTHSTTGMDTTCAAAANALLIYATLHWTSRPESYRALAATIGAAYLAFLARPDSLVYATMFPAGAALLLSGGERRWRLAAGFALGLAAVLALDSLVKLAAFGDPLPLAYYAKSRGYEGYLGRWNPIYYLFVFTGLALPFLIAIICFLGRSTLGVACVFLLPLVCTFGYLFSVVQIMGADARFYFPALPFVVVAAALVVDRWLLRPRRPRALLLRGAAVLALVVIVQVPSIESRTRAAYHRIQPPANAVSSPVDYSTPARTPPPRIGWWAAVRAVADICRRLPAGTTASMSEYGYAGANCPHVHIVDPIGLHDRAIAHGGFSAPEFFHRRPELIWFPHPDYSGIVAALLDAGELWSGYEFYPGAFDFGMAVRVDGPRYAPVRAAVAAVWTQHYPARDLDEHRARYAGRREQ